MPEPRRILLIGNSHLAALRDAHAADPRRWPGIAPRFVGLRGALMADLALAGGALVARGPAALAALRRAGPPVRPGDHDAIVIIGGGLAPQAALQPARAARLAALLAHRPGPDLGRRLGAATRRPLWLAPQPRPDPDLLQRRDPLARLYRAALAEGTGPDISAMFDGVARDIARSGGMGYVAQPAASRSRDILTRPDLMRGGTRLRGGPQPPDDLAHANAAYGALLLDVIAALPDQPA